jgi:hypothetical protein
VELPTRPDAQSCMCLLWARQLGPKTGDTGETVPIDFLAPLLEPFYSWRARRKVIVSMRIDRGAPAPTLYPKGFRS